MWIYVTVLLLFASASGEECSARSTNKTSIICVCNSSYCDTIPGVTNLEGGTYQLFTSTEDGLRLKPESGSISNETAINLVTVTIDRTKTYQTILGFGGAFTDSTGININSLPADAQEQLLRAYFSEDGAEFNLGRVPIGGADFSPRQYTYADSPNGTLDGFALQEEDYNYKIPYLLKAQNLTNNTLKLLASAWSPPAWMKTNHNITGSLGFLIDEYYQLWADYYLKFFNAYAENNITFWGVTTQNEPATGYSGGINCLAWTSEQLIQWLKENLGPTVKSGYPDLKILIHDDNTIYIPIVQEYYLDDDALSYIDGVAAHWYTSLVIPNDILYTVKTTKKDVFLLQTEACAGFLAHDNLEEPVELGSWSRASEYALTLFEFLNHDSLGWIDWNLALDVNGGPNYVDNYVDAPIIVNSTAGEFYKQPTYYVLTHFAKYVPRGSVRVEATPSLLAAEIKVSAFLRPDGAISAVLYNEGILETTVAVYDDSIGGHVYVTLAPGAISTLVYK